MRDRVRTWVVARIVAATLGGMAALGAMQPGSAAEDEAVAWNYEATAGPEQWGSLSPDFALCDEGRMQSPIDIAAPLQGRLPALATGYESVPLEIVNNGHTVEVVYESGSTLGFGDDGYALVQFHFHAPSEHTVDGRQFPAEMHFVHLSAAGDLAVIGVLVEEGAENAALASILANGPEQSGPEQRIAGVTVDAAALMPLTARYVYYVGSLTTPPCSEGVSWFVLRQTATASAEQIAWLTRVLNRNFRPVQPRNNRLVIDSE
jgi:carbonic anhydrase